MQANHTTVEVECYAKFHCYLYTRKHDGFDCYLITILDDHSRTVLASGLYERQTVSEVVAVLQDCCPHVWHPPATRVQPRQSVYLQ